MDYASLIREFLLDQRIRGNSAATLTYYEYCLRLFREFAEDRDLDMDLLRSYLLDLMERDYDSVSVQSYVRGLRSFLTWMHEQGAVSVNYSERFRLPKAERKVIDVLTDEELARIFAALDPRDVTQLRNLCIVSLMLDSGLRLDEVVTASRSKLHLSDRYLIVSGKGYKQRIVPFGYQTAASLTEYFQRIPETGLPDSLFLIWPGFGDPVPIGYDTVKMMFRHLREKSGVPKLHPHLLRHTFATRYLENGGNIFELQEILGHTSLEMVRRYSHLATSRIRRSYDAHSPLDCFEKEKQPRF